MTRRISDLTAGVVGVGFIGSAHIEALRRLGVHVAGVVGSSPERARLKAEPSGFGAVYDSVEAMAADQAIDVVHIASPNHVHAEQVRTVIAAGKHVVAEKPLALTSDDCADLVARAEATAVVNAVCFNIRFYAMAHQARAMVAAGAIGEPRLVTGHYLQDWLLLPTDWNWRLQPEKAGRLRAVADIGSHWLDLVHFITGRRVEAAMAELHTFVTVRHHPAGPVETFASAPVDSTAELVSEEMSSDDAASIMLRLEGGAHAIATVSQVSPGHRNSVSVEVSGSTDGLRWESSSPEQLWIGHRQQANELMPRDQALVDESVAALMGYPPGHVEGYPDTFRALFGQVYADVANGVPSPQPTYPTFADGLDAVRVTEAIARSSDEERWVGVDRGAREPSAQEPSAQNSSAHRKETTP